MTMTSDHRGELRGWHVLAMIVAFFAAVIAVDVGFSIIAVRTFPGEDEAHSYAQGLRYNQTLAQERAQRAMGWTAVAALDRSGQDAVVDLEIRDRSGAPLAGLAIEGALRRPVDAELDRPLTFTDLGRGRYRARIGRLHEGQWQMRARAQDGEGRALDFERSFEWPTS